MEKKSQETYNDAYRQIERLDNQRNTIVQQMMEIRSMAQGRISEQFLKVAHKGKQEPSLCGPYHALVRWNGAKGKTESKRLRTSEEITLARQDVENYAFFEQLCQRFYEITTQLSELERGSTCVTLKKKRKSPSKRTLR